MATFAYGLRLSKLTHRGILDHGPFRVRDRLWPGVTEVACPMLPLEGALASSAAYDAAGR